MGWTFEEMWFDSWQERGIFLSSTKPSDRYLVSPSFLLSGYRRTFPRSYSEWGQTAQSHGVPVEFKKESGCSWVPKYHRVMYRDNFTSICLGRSRTTFQCVEQCDNCDWQVWSEWAQNILSMRVCRCNRGFHFCGMWSWIDGTWTIEDEGGKFLRNVGKHSPSDAASQSKKRILGMFNP